MAISKHSRLASYEDPEIEALRSEAKALEERLQQLSAEKAEIEKRIHEFSIRHNRELGELIMKILQYRKEKSKGTPLEAEANKDYDSFYADYKTLKEEYIAILTEEEQKELKIKYRKAAKLCHPDVVEESQKEIAHKVLDLFKY